MSLGLLAVTKKENEMTNANLQVEGVSVNPTVKKVLTWFKTQIGKADQVVEEWHEGASFYRKYSSGFIEQGGFKPQGAGYYVTLFKSFSSADYSVVATVHVREGEGAQGVAQASANSSTRFYVRTRSGVNDFDDPCYWYAFGY